MTLPLQYVCHSSVLFVWNILICGCNPLVAAETWPIPCYIQVTQMWDLTEAN